MQAPDQIRITFDQNPALTEATRDKKPGDKMELELHLTIKAIDMEGVDFIVEAAVPEGFEVDEESEDAPSTGPHGSVPWDAMMTPDAMMVRKKAQS